MNIPPHLKRIATKVEYLGFFDSQCTWCAWHVHIP